MTGFLYDPTQPVLTFPDIRLTRLTQQDPIRCASVNEYAMATGIDVGQVLTLLGEALDSGDVNVEPAGGEIFVHTAPQGRPTPQGRAQIPPNLWELLRRNADVDTAFALWRLYRGLEQGGWSIEADPSRIPVIGGHTTLLGIKFSGHAIAPLLVLPNVDDVAAHTGPLMKYERAEVRVVGLVCRNGELEPMVTSVRRWMLDRPTAAQLNVIILEAPRYQPVLVSPRDAAVAPRSVSRADLDALLAQ